MVEALECLGGNGYVEESILPRLYREAPVNSIWEGSGNVICLDVLRAMLREPAALAGAAGGARPGARRRCSGSTPGGAPGCSGPGESGPRRSIARRLVEPLALALQAALLVRHAPAAVADAFCASRLADGGGRQFGTLPRGLDLARDLRARPPPARIGQLPPGTVSAELEAMPWPRIARISAALGFVRCFGHSKPQRLGGSVATARATPPA